MGTNQDEREENLAPPRLRPGVEAKPAHLTRAERVQWREELATKSPVPFELTPAKLRRTLDTLDAAELALYELVNCWIDDHEDETTPHAGCSYCKAVALLSQLRQLQTREYAFDVKLCGAVRVVAESEEAARRLMHDALDSVAGPTVDGVAVNEFSISLDSSDRPALFEIDGEPA